MLFGLPTALLSSIFGGLSGFLFKLLSQNQEIKAAERKHEREMLVAVAEAQKQATKQDIALLKAKADYEERLMKSDPHRSMARRVIAYVMVLALSVGLPALVLFGDINWFYLHEWTTNGFLGLGRKQVVEVITANGLPIAWLTTMLDVFAGIVAFYFGGSLAKFRNPYNR